MGEKFGGHAHPIASHHVVLRAESSRVRTSFLISKPGSRSIGQIRQIQLRIKSVEQLNFVMGDDPLGVWH